MTLPGVYPQGLSTEDLIKLERNACRLFRTFIPRAWPWYMPGRPFIDNWHIGAMAESLQAVSDEEIDRLAIAAPPRRCKSSVASVLWPAYEWTLRPARRFNYASHIDSLATRDADFSRKLMDSGWYQERWGCSCPDDEPHTSGCAGFRWDETQNEKGFYQNDRGGHRHVTSVGSSVTGFGGNILVADDLIDIDKARKSPVARQAVKDWWDSTWTGRRDPGWSAMVLFAQRTHLDDPTAHALKEHGWVYLKLQTEYNPKSRLDLHIKDRHISDPRTKPGELLWKAVDTDADVARRKLKTYVYSAQDQQEPVPPGGGYFKEHWFGFWYPKGLDLGPVERGETTFRTQAFELDLIDSMLQSWDCSFKDEPEQIKRKGSVDPVSGGVVARLKTDILILYRVLDVMNFPATKDAVRLMSRRFPKAHIKLIEEAANGYAVMQDLRSEIQGFYGVLPGRHGDKEERATKAWAGADHDAQAVSMLSLAAGGNVWLPHPNLRLPDHANEGSWLTYTWVWELLDNITAFPLGESDDDVDMLSQAVAHIQSALFLQRWKDEQERKNPPPKSTYEIELAKLHAGLRSRVDMNAGKKVRQNQGGMS